MNKDEKTKLNRLENVRPIWNRIANWWYYRTSTEEEIMSAEVAFKKTTYGDLTTSVEKLIKFHQKNINDLIKQKCGNRGDSNVFADYWAVYSFTKDVEPFIDRILQPFIDHEYQVINLSNDVKAIKDENVYLIGWLKDSLADYENKE